MESQVLISLLVTIILGLIGLVWGNNKAEIKALKTDIESVKKEATELTKRVQTVEDVQGINIIALQKDVTILNTKVDTLTDKVQSLASHVHNQKNTEGQLNQTLNLILKHLEKLEQ